MILSKDVLYLNINSAVWFLKCNVKIVNSIAETLKNEEIYEMISLLLNEYKSNQTLKNILQVIVKEIPLTGSVSWKTEYLLCNYLCQIYKNSDNC